MASRRAPRARPREPGDSCGPQRGGDERNESVMQIISYRWKRAVLLVTAVIAGPSAQQMPILPPAELMRAAVDNEVAANDQDAKFMYLDRKEDEHGSKTKLAVETTQATASMLVALDSRPLTPQQRQTEEARLQGMLNRPEEVRKKQKAEKEDAERTLRMVKALPDAFLYESDGEQLGEAGLGKPDAKLVRLKFRPNPDYKPPSRLEQVLAGMQGVILIDAAERRIARIDGTLIKDVGFGWGIFGHLDKGGHFLVQQSELGGGIWEVSRMKLDFTGKILVFKNLRIHSDQILSDFRRVPSNLTFAQGVKMLKERQTEAAVSRTSGDR